MLKLEEFFLTEEGQKYLKKFKSDIFIVKYGGAALEDKENMRHFLEDISQMFSHGIKIILVHGGGKYLSEKMKAANIPVEFENGMRKTTVEAVKIATDAFAELNEEICNYIEYYGVKTQSITHGKYIWGNLIDNKRKENRVGIINKIDIDKINLNCIPVISSIAKSSGEQNIVKGSYLNINADHLAVEMAKAIQSRKIIFISNVNGIYLDENDPKSKIDHVTKKEIHNLIDKKILTGGMKLKIEMSMKALDNGVKKVHFIDGRIKHSIIQEIFTDQGLGTEIVRE